MFKSLQKIRKSLSFSLTIIIAISAVLQNLSFAQILKSDLPVTNSGIYTMYKDGNTMYVGGPFSYAGPSTGRGVLLDSQTGLYDKNFPKVNGTINVCVPDNNGGWYIGGQFTKVGSEFRNSVAHIRAGGQIDDWNPNIIFAEQYYGTPLVNTIALNNSIIYIGGAFDRVGSAVRNNLTAVDLNGVATSWNPDPTILAEINTIVATDTVVYFGGNFATLNVGINANIPRLNLAAVDVKDGMPTSWNAPVTGQQSLIMVYGLCLSDTILFVCGNFDYIGGMTRHRVGAVSTKLAGNSGTTVTSWNPQTTNYFLNPTAIIYSIITNGDSVFIGGNFDKFGASARTKLALVSKSSGAIFPWNPVFSEPSWAQGGVKVAVKCLAIYDNTLYVGGSFSVIQGITRNNLAAFDLKDGTLNNWNPYVSNSVLSIQATSGGIYAGGDFTSVN
ncbi:MAG: hypothetical protein P4L35_14850, partial [Ignavibacteriaceae bacterium]|nr:hypothetical protein [Ignavibacteriaceae bacterium]